MPAIHGVVRWRIIDLCQWVCEEFRVVVSKQMLSRELRVHGLSQALRPSAPSCAGRRRASRNLFKNIPRAPCKRIARQAGVDPGAIEIWFADEARIGQKNKITRRWAKPGSRPSAPM